MLVLKEKGKLLDMMDPRLGSDYNKEEVMGMINVALSCTNASPTLRPTMSAVVSMLEGRSVVLEPISESSVASDDLRFKAIRNQYQHSKDNSMNDSQTQSISIDGPWTDSSTSAPDLYPINLDSQYFKNRE